MKNLLLILLIALIFSSCKKRRNGKTLAINVTEVLNENLEFKITKDTFDFKFYPQFNQQLDNGKQVLLFKVTENQKDGILIIDKDKLNFKFLR